MAKTPKTPKMPKWIFLDAPAAARKAIADAAWAFLTEGGSTAGMTEWPVGSGQQIWWKGAPTGEGTEWASYGDDDYCSTVKSGIAVQS